MPAPPPLDCPRVNHLQGVALVSEKDSAFIQGLLQNGFINAKQADKCAQALDERVQGGEQVTALQVAVDLGLVDPRHLEAEVKSRSASKQMPAVAPGSGALSRSREDAREGAPPALPKPASPTTGRFSSSRVAAATDPGAVARSSPDAREGAPPAAPKSPTTGRFASAKVNAVDPARSSPDARPAPSGSAEHPAAPSGRTSTQRFQSTDPSQSSRGTSQRMHAVAPSPTPPPADAPPGRAGSQRLSPVEPGRTDSRRTGRLGVSGEGGPRPPGASGDGSSEMAASGRGLPAAISRTDSARMTGRPGTVSGATALPPLPPEVELTDYEPSEKLGTGPIGPSYLARRRSDGAEVVVKVVSPRFQEHPEVLDQLRRDLRAWTGYEAPGAAGPIAAGTLAGKRVVVYPKLAGSTLEDVVRKQGPFPAKQAMQIVQLLARALVSAHGRNQGVGDVRAAKVIWDGQRAVLTDLGLARASCLAAGFGQYGMTFGHPAYLAPEVLQEGGQRQPSPVADVYALGMLLYLLVCGRLPFQGSAQEMLTQHLQASLPPPPPGNAQISTALAGLILKLTAKSPQSRLADARAAVEALQLLIERTADAPLQPAPVGKKPSAELQKKLLHAALEEEPKLAPDEFDPTTSLCSDDQWGVLVAENAGRTAGGWSVKKIAEPEKVGPKDWDELSVDEANKGVSLELKNAVQAAVAAQDKPKGTSGRAAKQTSARLVSGSGGGVSGSNALFKYAAAIAIVVSLMVGLALQPPAPRAVAADPRFPPSTAPVAPPPPTEAELAELARDREKLKGVLIEFVSEVRRDAETGYFARAIQRVTQPPAALERAPDALHTLSEVRAFVFERIDEQLRRRVEKDFYDLVRVGELEAAQAMLDKVAEWAKTRPAYELLRQQLERLKKVRDTRMATPPAEKGVIAQPMDLDRIRPLVMSRLPGGGANMKLYPKSRGIAITYKDAVEIERDLVLSSGVPPKMEALPGTGAPALRIGINKEKPTLLLHRLPLDHPIEVTLDLVVAGEPKPAPGAKVALLCGLSADDPEGVGISWGLSPVKLMPTTKRLIDLHSGPTPTLAPNQRLTVELTLDPSGRERRMKLGGALVNREVSPPTKTKEGEVQVSDEDLRGRLGIYVEGCEVWVQKMEVLARLDPKVLEKPDKPDPPVKREPVKPAPPAPETEKKDAKDKPGAQQPPPPAKPPEKKTEKSPQRGG